MVFLDLGNLSDILRQVAEKGILAVGMTAVVIAGGIDLSVGSMLALGATLGAWMLMHGGVGLAGTTFVCKSCGQEFVVRELSADRDEPPALPPIPAA